MILQIAENILIEKIKNGDKTAFESIFKSYYNQLCSYANKFVKDIDNCEEIVQEIFFQVWQNKNKIVIQTSLKSYLFRSVHNSCLNYIKHKYIEQKHIESTLFENKNSSQNFIDIVESNELHDKIRITIDKLPPERKKIFLMIRFENLKYAEVAKKLNISIKTVENQMGSALKFMRYELKEYLPMLILLSINFIYNF